MSNIIVVTRTAAARSGPTLALNLVKISYVELIDEETEGCTFYLNESDRYFLV